MGLGVGLVMGLGLAVLGPLHVLCSTYFLDFFAMVVPGFVWCGVIRVVLVKIMVVEIGSLECSGELAG